MTSNSNANRQWPAEVFKAYDIRGIVPDTINAGFARALGRALAEHAQAAHVDTLVVGRDGRQSGPELAQALKEGILAGGVNVIDIGQVPTPLVYFAAHTQETGSGVAITGSHNPPRYNGFKMMLAGDTLFGDRIQTLAQTMTTLLPDRPAGTAREMNIIDTYIQRVIGDVRLQRPLKVAVDCGNGVAGAVAPALYRALGCEVVELFCEVDGSFPNHHPDPADPQNLQDLIQAVQTEQCDLGLAFDGDGDRLGVVTRSGEIIWPDRQLMLFARDVLSRNPGAKIIYDVKCSRYVAQVIREAGGQPLMWRTGHSYIKDKLRETGAPLAGEMSGHIFFKERWYGFDDGLYSGARLLEILAAHPDPSAVLEALPQAVSTPEIKLETAEGEQFKLVAELQRRGEFSGAQEIVTIDGVRVEYADGFGLARSSNTTPVVVLRFEADDQAALERIQHQFREQIRRIAPEAELPF